MRLYRIDYPKILWGIVLLSLPFAMPRAAEAEPTRKETARQVGLALSQADAPTRQEAVKKQLAAFSELSRLTAREAGYPHVFLWSLGGSGNLSQLASRTGEGGKE